MSTLDVQKLKDDAVEWALTHGVAFKESSYSAVHTPFTLTPTPISRKSYQYLKNATGILSKLIYSVSEDHDFLYSAIYPIKAGNAFFSALLNIHHQGMLLDYHYSLCVATLWMIIVMGSGL